MVPASSNNFVILALTQHINLNILPFKYPPPGREYNVKGKGGRICSWVDGMSYDGRKTCGLCFVLFVTVLLGRHVASRVEPFWEDVSGRWKCLFTIYFVNWCEIDVAVPTPTQVFMRSDEPDHGAHSMPAF